MTETEAETVTVGARIPSSLFYERLLLLLAAVLMFAAGSCVYDIISLPVPAPSNYIRLFFALLYSTIFSFHSIILINILMYFGKVFDASPANAERQKCSFPSWIMEQPFFGIFLGLSLFSSPFLIAIGLSGVAYLLAVGLVLYLTPRLIAKGYLGYGLLSTLYLAAGFILATLITRIPDTSMCVDDKVVPLRSGAAVPCDVYSFVDKVDGMIIEHGQSSIFVPLKDLAPHEITALGPGSWFIRGEIRPID